MRGLGSAELAAHRAPTRRVLARYALFQLPGFSVAAIGLYSAVHWFELAPHWGWIGLGLWVLKDAVMFPLVRIAYEPDGSGGGTLRLVGGLAVADGPIDPAGTVHVGPERWRAELAPGAAPVERGAAVRIVEMRGLVLRVEPLEGASAS